jgi:hypothetical protein
LRRSKFWIRVDTNNNLSWIKIWNQPISRSLARRHRKICCTWNKYKFRIKFNKIQCQGRWLDWSHSEKYIYDALNNLLLKPWNSKTLIFWVWFILINKDIFLHYRAMARECVAFYEIYTLYIKKYFIHKYQCHHNSST